MFANHAGAVRRAIELAEFLENGLRPGFDGRVVGDVQFRDLYALGCRAEELRGVVQRRLVNVCDRYAGAAGVQDLRSSEAYAGGAAGECDDL